jgi:hypothetical protein
MIAAPRSASIWNTGAWLIAWRRIIICESRNI